MSVGERDPHTGHMTTGHQWNGIKELNTKVPKPVWFFLITTFLLSLIMWILLPAWPMVSTFTKGTLGLDERAKLTQELQNAKNARHDLAERILTATYQEAEADDKLMAHVRGAGRTLFNDNCAACHGTDGAGGPGYPNLIDPAWLWKEEGEPIENTIMETLRVGINDPHEDTRSAEMLAFGQNGTLDRKSVTAIIDYIESVGKNSSSQSTSLQGGEGKELFVENCAACHGENAQGDSELGAPDLTDSFWIYGNNRQALFDSIWKGRKGHMPSWEARLSEADRKLLTLYVLDLQTEQTNK